MQYFQLFTRIFKGVPNSLRGKVWSKLLDIDNQKRLHSGVYAKMIQSARKYSLDLRQIDLDINRTFRDNIAYRKRYCPRYSDLNNSLFLMFFAISNFLSCFCLPITDKFSCLTFWPHIQYTIRKSAIVKACPIYALYCSCTYLTKRYFCLKFRFYLQYKQSFFLV
jgi:hypothetical protein